MTDYVFTFQSLAEPDLPPAIVDAVPFDWIAQQPGPRIVRRGPIVPSLTEPPVVASFIADPPAWRNSDPPTFARPAFRAAPAFDYPWETLAVAPLDGWHGQGHVRHVRREFKAAVNQFPLDPQIPFLPSQDSPRFKRPTFRPHQNQPGPLFDLSQFADFSQQPVVFRKPAFKVAANPPVLDTTLILPPFDLFQQSAKRPLPRAVNRSFSTEPPAQGPMAVVDWLPGATQTGLAKRKPVKFRYQSEAGPVDPPALDLSWLGQQQTIVRRRVPPLPRGACTDPLAATIVSRPTFGVGRVAAVQCLPDGAAMVQCEMY